NGTADAQSNARFGHIALLTDDVDGDYEKALKWGAADQMKPADAEIKGDAETIKVRIAFVKGPDNESVEFFKVL
ncbi:MAG: hypothetical protein FWE82_09740, partial [Defluviitaleaceae bacterium]|nr:hypothetical protein [Defluviitaleaceae bacterium]